MNRNEINSNQTKKSIRDSFMKFFSEIGIDRLSIGMICEDCCISRTTFYRYYPDKYSILEEIEYEIFDTGIDATTKGNYSGTSDMFLGIMQYAYEHRDYLKPLMGPHGDQQFLLRWQNYIAKDFKKTFSRKRKPKNFNAVVSFKASGLLGLFSYWFNEEPDLTPKEMAALASKLMLDFS